MLTGIALVKAITVPLLLGLLLIVSLRRTSNPIRAITALAVGGLAAFVFNAVLLRLVPPVYSEGQLLTTTATQAWLSGFLEAALPEELSKGAVMTLLLLVWRGSGARQGALLGGMVGLGFALFENLMNALVAPDFRVLAVVSHGAWGIIMGRLLQWALIDSKPAFWKVLLAFPPTVIFHGLIDTTIFLVEVHESKYGPDPVGEGVPASAILAMFAAMVLTMAISIIELVWATLIVWRVRRSLQLTANPDESGRSAVVKS